MSDSASQRRYTFEMNDTGLQLLQRYAQDNSQDSFAALVKRHLNLVFSAALRQVHSPQLAEEVAQSVFADLAQSATKLKPDTILPAWLYEVTRRTAIDVVRRESRRQLREKVAHELTAMNATADDWTHIEPFLDEAMHALDEIDRAAVLLRYFENKTLREVGETLGISDDAAQKRVSRAVERLREFFTKRGVSIGASGLVIVISTNAIQAAPIGLAVTVSTAAALAGTITTATLVTHTTMNWITAKTVSAILGSALIAGTGTYLLQQREANRLRNENQKLVAAEGILGTGRGADLRATGENIDEVQRLQKEKNELIRLRGEVGVLRQQVVELKKVVAENRQLPGAPILQKQAQQLSVEEFNQHRIVTVDAMKNLALGMRLYAGENKEQFPTNFNQMKDMVNIQENFDLGTIEFVNPGLVNEMMPQALGLRERVPR